METLRIKQATALGWIETDNGGVADLSFPTSKTRRGRVEERGQICPTITTSSELYVITLVKGEPNKLKIEHNGEEYEVKIRKLCEDECFILMGMTAEDCAKCKNVGTSKTQLFRQAGNGLVSNCITLVLEHLFKAQYDNTYECTDERILREQAMV